MTTLLERTRRARGTWTVAAQQWRHDLRGHIEFIHINKTGGSSIEKALGLPFCHQTASMRIDCLGVEEWNRRYSFTFVRNPWDRLVSQYHYRKGRGRLKRDIDFPGWVRGTLVDQDEHLRGWSVMFMSQVARITGPGGQIVVDDVYRFEDFASEFARLCRTLGRSDQLPHAKPSTHRHYLDYYDEATARLVGEFFAEDVEAFGYALDGP